MGKMTPSSDAPFCILPCGVGGAGGSASGGVVFIPRIFAIIAWRFSSSVAKKAIAPPMREPSNNNNSDDSTKGKTRDADLFFGGLGRDAIAFTLTFGGSRKPAFSASTKAPQES